MAVAEADKVAEVRAEMLAHKKRASDLQGEVDSFAKERKRFQELEDENSSLKAKLEAAGADLDDAKAQIGHLEGELAKSAKALAKAEALVAAAKKVKEGLAELG